MSLHLRGKRQRQSNSRRRGNEWVLQMLQKGRPVTETYIVQAMATGGKGWRGCACGVVGPHKFGLRHRVVHVVLRYNSRYWDSAGLVATIKVLVVHLRCSRRLLLQPFLQLCTFRELRSLLRLMCRNIRHLLAGILIKHFNLVGRGRMCVLHNARNSEPKDTEQRRGGGRGEGSLLHRPSAPPGRWWSAGRLALQGGLKRIKEDNV